jgi:cell division protein FtsI (penicillin-binding protein 3)
MKSNTPRNGATPHHGGGPRMSRIGIVHISLALFALTILVQAARVQLLQTDAWRARAQRQHYTQNNVPAARGEILDVSGRVLAENREAVRLEIAPKEVNDPAKLRRVLLKAGVSREWVGRALDRRKAWVTLPGRYLALDVAAATAMRGVYATTMSLRSYAISEGSRAIIGRVDAEGKAVDGLELALDSVLQGRAGSTTLVRDVRGRGFQSPAAPAVAAVPGHTVVLTLNHELQEIAERALSQAVDQMSADGGDIVILDPKNGELRALASQRGRGAGPSATAITEPFEPGSTMKPFIAAGLLARNKVTDHDSVDTGDGVLDINGRQIHDEHLVGRAPLADVLRWSSNVGIVKFARRLSPREEFETLRDFGFGTSTGVSYPSESNGTLREPTKWSEQSAASLAIGYEIAATPLQLAVAYAAFANGGQLLEPSLVKEIRAPDGTVVFRHEPRVVRQVVPRDVADKVRAMLLNVVENGTALQADISNYLLAGKTGTPRRTVRGRYAEMQYNPNFVGLFPGDAPQYVIVVKLTNPKGTFYGGTTAAPVTKAVLQAAIAARDAALDRDKLASSAIAAGSRAESSVTKHTGANPSRPALVERSTGETLHVATTPARSRAILDSERTTPVVVPLPLRATREPPAQPPRAVPDVRGMSLRDAVRSLHSAGFRVQLARSPGGRGADANTTPASGTVAQPGTLVRLQYAF